jgi:hypothetical protein
MTDDMRLKAQSGFHPEVVLGIPSRIITAIGSAKIREAEKQGYEGPLTLQDAVERGDITQAEASYLERSWRQSEGGPVKPSLFRMDCDRKSAAGGER